MKKQQKIVYSCKRRKDLVTFLAIAMFTGIILFEIYLVFILPVQLRQKDAMVTQVEKQRVVAMADAIRYRIFCVKPDQDLICEYTMVSGALDVMAMYLRENQDRLTLEQIMTAKQMLLSYSAIVGTWTNKNIRRISLESFDKTPLIRNMERKYGIPPVKETPGKK